MRFFGFQVALVVLCACSAQAAAPADLSPWTVVQYQLFDQPQANWVLSDSNHVATQTVNADASYLRSDFVLTDSAIDGSWRVNTNSDDDFMGFVFGEQDPNHYYLFDWKKADQNDSVDGFAQVGMTIKVVNRASGDMAATDLWPTAGSANVTSLMHNSIPWQSFTDYQFHLEFHPGEFTIDIHQDATLLQSWTISDSTYTTGHFGFYNYSQDSVVYNGFTLTAVPEPSSCGLILMGVVGLSVRRRRSHR